MSPVQKDEARWKMNKKIDEVEMKQVATPLPVAERNELKEVAERGGRKIAGLLRVLIREHLAQVREDGGEVGRD